MILRKGDRYMYNNIETGRKVKLSFKNNPDHGVGIITEHHNDSKNVVHDHWVEFDDGHSGWYSRHMLEELV